MRRMVRLRIEVWVQIDSQLTEWMRKKVVFLRDGGDDGGGDVLTKKACDARAVRLHNLAAFGAGAGHGQ